MARQYDNDTKAAVMAALMTGQSISSVAKQWNIPKGTVSGWNKQKHGVVSKSTQKKEEIGRLLITYLHTNLNTLNKQSEVFADVDWLKQQAASELAVLHGVIADKSIRLLESLASSEQEN